MRQIMEAVMSFVSGEAAGERDVCSHAFTRDQMMLAFRRSSLFCVVCQVDDICTLYVLAHKA